MKHMVLLVVSCCTKFEDTWSGKCLGWMNLLFIVVRLSEMQYGHQMCGFFGIIYNICKQMMA